MKILVFEYITGGGLCNQQLPPSLAREGDLMLQALLQDLSVLPDVEVWVFRDSRLLLPGYGNNIHLLPVLPGSDIDAQFDAWVQHCDAIWPIAPETGALLEGLCARVQAAGKVLLTPAASAVRVCGDKQRTLEVLKQHAIAAVSFYTLAEDLPAQDRRWVVKAKDGAGCADSYIVADNDAYRSVKASLDNPDNFLLQPFVYGKPVSLSCLFQNGRVSLLSYNEQLLAIRGSHFELQGCRVNALCPDWEHYRLLSGRVARAFPELWGYAGLDVLETPEGPLMLEINPRLTTSYAGLRQALQSNIAQLILNLASSGLPSTVPHGQPVTITLTKEYSDGA